MMVESVTDKKYKRILFTFPNPNPQSTPFIDDILTLPQEDTGGIAAACSLASASNCSANPHEQFLHAFRFPPVSQSGPVSVIILFVKRDKNGYMNGRPSLDINGMY